MPDSSTKMVDVKTPVQSKRFWMVMAQVINATATLLMGTDVFTEHTVKIIFLVLNLTNALVLAILQIYFSEATIDAKNWKLRLTREGKI